MNITSTYITLPFIGLLQANAYNSLVTTTYYIVLHQCYEKKQTCYCIQTLGYRYGYARDIYTTTNGSAAAKPSGRERRSLRRSEQDVLFFSDEKKVRKYRLYYDRTRYCEIVSRLLYIEEGIPQTCICVIFFNLKAYYYYSSSRLFCVVDKERYF